MKRRGNSQHLLMKRSDNYRRRKELINEIERQKIMVERFGSNSWKMSLRSNECGNYIDSSNCYSN